VWVPPADVRDLRELPRTRTMPVRGRTRVKNRILSSYGRHGLRQSDFSDSFGKGGRNFWIRNLVNCPSTAGRRCMFAELDCLEQQIRVLQTRIEEVLTPTPEHRLLRSLPGVGFLLAAVIATEIGDIRHCKRAESLTCYAGVEYSFRASGGKSRQGGTYREPASPKGEQARYAHKPTEACIPIATFLSEPHHAALTVNR